MASVASCGTAERIAARTFFRVLRAGFGTPARYSSTFFGTMPPFAAEPRALGFAFFIAEIVQRLLLQVHLIRCRAVFRCGCGESRAESGAEGLLYNRSQAFRAAVEERWRKESRSERP